MDIRNYSSEEEINLKKYFVLIGKKWRWFILSLIVFVALAFVMTPKVYYTFTTLQIKDQSQNATGIDQIIQQLGGNNNLNAKNLETELVILKSLYLTKRALQELDFTISYFKKGKLRDQELYKEAPFLIKLNKSHQQTYYTPVNIKILNDKQFQLEIEGGIDTTKVLEFGSWFVNDYFAFQVEKQEWLNYFIGEEYSFHINQLDKMASIYQQNLTASLANEDATVISLNVEGDLENKNIDFLNQLTNVYIQDNLEAKNQVAVNTLNFIDAQLNRIVDSLQLAEGDLQLFRQNNKIIDLSKEGSSLFDKLEELQNQKSVLDVKIKYYNYLLNYIDTKNDFKDIISPSIMGIDDQLLNKLVGDLSALNQEKKVLEYSVQSNNPQIDVIDVRIKNTIESLVEVVTNIIQGAEIKKADIEDKIQHTDRQIARLPMTERKMIRIQRKFELNDNIYNFLQQKRAEAGIASASNVSDSSVIDYASHETSSSSLMKTIISYLAAVIFAFLFPAILIILFELTGKTISYFGDIPKSTQIQVAGLIPPNHHKTEYVVSEDSECYISESFRALRTNFLKKMEPKESYVIASSSIFNGEKKSFSAINLATAFALLDKRVLLADFDFRHPKVSEAYELTSNKGAQQYLQGTIDLHNATSKSKMKNLDIIPTGGMPNNPGELLWHERSVQFIEDAKQRYDIVIIDCPPLGLVSDAEAIFPYADFQLINLRQGYSQKTSFVMLNELHKEYKDSMKLAVLDVDNISGIEFAKQFGGFKFQKKYRAGYFA